MTHDPMCQAGIWCGYCLSLAKCSCERPCECDLIARVREDTIKQITPECTCGHDGLEHYWHLVPCRQGAFLMSQYIDKVWEEA